MLPSDDVLLASLEQKLQIVRDRVRGVAEGYTNGFYLHGEGGTSKSFTVEQTLRTLGKAFKVSNTRCTARGLFNLLRDYPDAVHILEDAETLFADKNSFGVLRSALWGQVGRDGKQERVVCWQTADERAEFAFEGGLVVIANVPLDDVPQLRAVKTRIPSIHYQPTNEEVAALMRKIARHGYTYGDHSLSPEECLEVATEIVDRSRRLERNLDLRLLVNTFNDRIQWRNGAAETHWVDLLDSRLRERATAPAGCGVLAERKARELAVVRRIVDLPPQQRLESWKTETGKSQAALYRRIEDLNKERSNTSLAT
jgi:hypothetical protein